MNKNTKNFDLKNQVNDNLPVLLTKTIKKIKVIKPLIHLKNDTGKTRHYTPAAQEWSNSVYNFNANYTKSLPLADLGLMKLLKAYFFSNLKNTLTNVKRLPNRFRRHSTKKIFVGKGEIKHNNDKAIVTFYVHNAERLFLDRAIFLLNRFLYEPLRPLKRYIFTNKHKQVKMTYNRILSFNEYWHLSGKHLYYQRWSNKYFVDSLDIINLILKNINKQYYLLNSMKNLNIITEETKNKSFINLCENVLPLLSEANDPKFEEIKPIYEKHYINNLRNLKLLKLFNTNKFRHGYINGLIKLVEKLYDKKVELNIVKLKKLHLNSDLYTQTIALKLKNRKNRLYKVLKSSLNKVSLPLSRATRSESVKGVEISRNSTVTIKNDIINNIRNDNINTMFKNNVNDSLNSLLLDTFSNNKIEEISSFTSASRKKSPHISLQESVLKSLKHISMRGIRIEVKGRATRRLTASRSLFKMKWKGALKNTDSSFKGLSAILLRGHVKSNIQYTYIGTKNRNGAIGVKGWISSK